MPGFLRGLFVLFFLGSIASAAVLDRIAVIIGKTVITESEVLDELRLTQFINRQPLNLGSQQRRAAAERLIDQVIIRNEMDVGQYFQEPSASDDGTVLRKFRQEVFGTPAQYLMALAQYQITEEQLKGYLLRQLAVSRFSENRFGFGASLYPASIGGGPAISVDEQMNAWLKLARSNARIVFNPEAFQ